MRKQIIAVAAIALTSTFASTGTLAHVADGALTDGANNPVKDGAGKCVVVADGKFSSQCHAVKPKKVEAPAPAPTPAPVVESVSLSGDALFGFDSAELSQSGKASLEDVIARASSLTVTKINVVGHTDSLGDDTYNQGLSEKRAASVKAYLVSKGMNGSNVYTSGAGESSPVASNNNREGRALNRRVDIMVTGLRK